MRASESYTVVIMAISFFRSSEEVSLADVEQLAKQISAAQRWIAPIPVEKNTGIVMDGNHRLQAAKLLGLTHLPCVLIEYDDPRVSVFEWDKEHPYPVDDIFHAVIHSEQVLPYKTTRHVFSPPLPQTEIGLRELMLPVAASTGQQPSMQ